MLFLWERGPTPVKDLVTALQLDYGTLSPLLKRLEAAGFIERRRRSDDERCVQVVLTPAGRDLKVAAGAIPPRIVSAYDLTAEEFDALRATLVRLTASVAGEETPAG